MTATFLPVIQPDDATCDKGCAPEIASPDTVEEWLSLSARFRFASLLLELPTAAVLGELRQLSAELPDVLRAAAAELAATPLPDWESAYHAALGPAGCPACESSYDDAAIGSRGPLLADVSGFYRAFAYSVRSDTPSLPDHASVELDFLSFLAIKAAFALHQGCDEEYEVTTGALQTFAAIHPGFWLERFCARLEGAEVPLYAAISGWLRNAVIPAA